MRQLILVVAAWVFLGGATLRADQLFTTFGSGDSFDQLNGYAVLGSNNVVMPGYIATAMEFSPSKTATFDSARFAAFGISTGSIDGVLAADGGGVPGPSLEKVGSVTVPTLSLGTIYSLNSSLHPLLTAGSPYWFILQPTDPNSDVAAGWNLSSPAITGLGAQTFDPAQGSWGTNSATTLAAFEINGTPVGSAVPEPCTLTLLGVGGLLILRLSKPPASTS
jgi:hypothetical protein